MEFFRQLSDSQWLAVGISLAIFFLTAIHSACFIYINWFTKDKRDKRKASKSQQDIKNLADQIYQLTGKDLSQLLGQNVNNDTLKQQGQIMTNQLQNIHNVIERKANI